MRENQYIWDPKSQNYFGLEKRKELIGRYSFKSSQSPSNLASQQLPELEDYHNLPLYLKKDSYQKLILYTRKHNLDYNNLIEDALDIYMENTDI